MRELRLRGCLGKGRVMTRWARRTTLGLLLTTAITPVAVQAAEPGEQVLLQTAEQWRLKDRPDLALDALAKLLSSNPRHGEALYQAASLEMRRGNAAAAQIYISRLRAVSPGSPRLAELANGVPPPLTATATSADSDDLTERPQMAQATGTDTTVDTGERQPAASPAAGSNARVAPVQVAQLELVAPGPIAGVQIPLAATPEGLPTTAAPTPEDTLELDIERSMRAITAESAINGPMITGALAVRAHTGTPGTSQLLEAGTPFEAQFVPWGTGTLRFSVLPAYLDAGRPSVGTSANFGANPILFAAGLPLAQVPYQSAMGVGLLGAYSSGRGAANSAPRRSARR